MNIENVDYTTKIPNNVNLAEDRQVLRALESWHPGYIDWWKDMGPEGFQEALVYLRTAGHYRALTFNPNVIDFSQNALARFDIVHFYGLYDLLGPAVSYF